MASTIRHLEGIGRTDIPVFAGNNKPARPGRIENIKAEKKLWGRGHDSHLGAAGYPQPASWQETYRERYNSEPTVEPKAEDPSDFIIRTIKENPHKVTIVGIGTGGNIAKALEKDPSIAPLAKEIVYMAGAFLQFENYIWDVLAASYVLDPSIVTEEVFMPVDVNDTYSLSYGETLAFAGPGPEGSQKAHIVQKINRKKVWKIVTDTFDKL